MLNKGYRDRSISRLEEIGSKYKYINRNMLEKAENLYVIRVNFKDTVDSSWEFLNSLRNIPTELNTKLKAIKIETSRFIELEKIIRKEAEAIDFKSKGGAVAGVAGGIGVAALGPTAAMGIAMTFGTASTGTAIATLSGAAATNAALAWLGGGALAAGGGGMALGNAFLALAGPVGWAIGGIGLVGAGVFSRLKNKEIAEKANRQSSELEAHIRLNQGLIKEMDFIKQEIYETSRNLTSYLITCSGNERDFNKMNSDEKNDIGSLINNTQAGAKLLNKGIGENK